MSSPSSSKVNSNQEFNKLHKSDFAILFAWVVMALVVAYRRSLWGDEWNHVQDLKNGLVWATQEILRKPSPFAPGEVVLNWIPKMILTPWNGPMEVWARVQNIGWAAGTLAIALNLSRQSKLTGDIKDLRFLPLLVGFSAALISYATEMRPYASLFFSGAVVAKILLDGKVSGRAFHFVVWFAILFGHLYGVCFILAACILSTKLKEWKKIAGGILYLGMVFSLTHVTVGQAPNSLPPLVDILKQTLGTLGNPHKASYILGPLAILGILTFWKSNRQKTVQLLVMLSIMILGPILATYLGKYFFVPRQVVAGSFVFLLFAALGFSELTSLLPKSFVFMVAIAISIIPWTLSTLLAVPPFSNQPFHRFREVSQEIAVGPWKSLLFTDFCNSGPFEDYLSQAKGSLPVIHEKYELEGFSIAKSCWQDGLCFHFLTDIKYCAVGANDLMPGTGAARLFETGKFDLILHGSLQEFNLSKKIRQVPLRRVW